MRKSGWVITDRGMRVLLSRRQSYRIDKIILHPDDGPMVRFSTPWGGVDIPEEEVVICFSTLN